MAALFVTVFDDSLVLIPKSWEYCNAVSCLKWETACRFSATVVSNVHNSMSSRQSLLIEAMLLWRRRIPSSRRSSETLVLLDTVPSGLLVAVVSFILYRCFTSETVFVILSFTYDTLLGLRHLAYKSVSTGVLYYRIGF